ncbi:HET-domain-containing protein [Annulohypoxylon nitens]|nr:HET-domain-containing protein [Annulohypoxylon nitens]
MWLLHTTSFGLHEFIGQKKPPYAILSHTWGNGEVLFQDVQNLQDTGWKLKPGYKKVAGSCRQAAQDGYDYIWIDTCCIDKTSSAELSEAINSMFQWYKASAVCYAFLEDVSAKSDFLSSRWFTRGWTLQELIAPRNVLFYNQEWNLLGDRFQLASEISHQTQIGVEILTRGHINNEDDWTLHKLDRSSSLCSSCHCFPLSIQHILRKFCVAEKMNWASKRKTTRVEDIAYCLLGIFEVNMTLLYGEGLNAFRRLQEEILKRSDDQSILTWRDSGLLYTTILAKHPRQFQLGAYCIRHPPPKRCLNPKNRTTHNIQLISNKLLLSTHLYHFTSDSHFGREWRVVVLDCIVGTDLISRPALLLCWIGGKDNRFWRAMLDSSWVVEPIGPTDERSQLVCYSNKPDSPGFPQFDKRTKLFRSVVSGLDLNSGRLDLSRGHLDPNNGHMEDITIVECTSEDLSLLPPISSINDYDDARDIRSRIVELKQHGIDTLKCFRAVGSIPPWTDNQNLTLPFARDNIAAFENDSSAFFVIWGFGSGPFILSPQDLFLQLQTSHPSIDNCKITDILGTLRRTRFQGLNLQPFSECPKIIGEPGSTQFQVEVETMIRTWLGSRVLEVRINISNYTNEEGA